MIISPDKTHPLLLIMAVSCLPNCASLVDRHPTYVIGGSINVYHDGAVSYSPQDVENVLRATSRHSGHVLHPSEEDINHDLFGPHSQLNITFHEYGPLQCPTNSWDECAGYVTFDYAGGAWIHVWTNDPCIAKSAFAHEVIHALAFWYGRSVDYDHNNIHLWAERSSDAVEQKVYDKLVQLCN